MSRKGARGGRRVWCAVSALDVFSSALSRGGSWPAVLRPASVAQRLDAAGSAVEEDSAVRTGPAPNSDPALNSGPASTAAASARSASPQSVPDHWPERGEGLCDRAFGFADAAPVRSVHWFLGPRGTLIAESAWGSAASAVLVGWAPHEDAGAGGGAGEAAVARESGVVGVAGRRAANHRASLPGVLLLGVFDTADTARRLAELVPESAHADIAVVGRWALPDCCPPMSVRSVVHPEPGVLRRELITQLTEAFVRVQEGVQTRARTRTQTRAQDSRR